MNKLTYINPEARIGASTQIDPFSCIHENVIIGSNCWIGSNVTIFPGARIGDNVKVFPGAVISAIPQDLKFKGEKTIVKIGNNVTIRECVTINRGTSYNNETIVEDNCLLMAYSHVAHDCIIRRNVIIANGVAIAGHVEIDEFSIIGGLAAIQQFTKIGKNSMISGIRAAPQYAHSQLPSWPGRARSSSRRRPARITSLADPYRPQLSC